MGGYCSRRAPSPSPRRGPDVDGEGLLAQPTSPAFDRKHNAYVDAKTLQPRPCTWDQDAAADE